MLNHLIYHQNEQFKFCLSSHLSHLVVLRVSRELNMPLNKTYFYYLS